MCLLAAGIEDSRAQATCYSRFRCPSFVRRSFSWFPPLENTGQESHSGVLPFAHRYPSPSMIKVARVSVKSPRSFTTVGAVVSGVYCRRSHIAERPSMLYGTFRTGLMSAERDIIASSDERKSIERVRRKHRSTSYLRNCIMRAVRRLCFPHPVLHGLCQTQSGEIRRMISVHEYAAFEDSDGPYQR